MTTTLTPQLETDQVIAGLEASLATPDFAPAFRDGAVIGDSEADWPIIAAVAAVIGIAVAVVAYICSVCQARSYNACLSAVRKYFGKGC